MVTGHWCSGDEVISDEWAALLALGAGYKDETSQAEKEDDEVDPGKTHTYVWEILEDQGPTESDASCLTYSYFSYTDSVKDINSGLIGALLVCRPGEGHGESEK